MGFSLLLSVYSKEKPEYMLQCFESIYQQTLPPSEIILVEDGTLTEELYEVIETLKQRFAKLKIVSYSDNRGLGYALNLGLQYCNHDIVARMDTDDICYPERFQVQFDFLKKNTDVHVVSAWIDEFVDNVNNVISTRELPESHAQISEFAKKRNPINHPAVMFRKNAIMAVGGYQPFYMFEDYHLWVRLLIAGYKLYNIPQSLLYFRQTKDMFNRRGGISYIQSEVKFQQHLYQVGFISVCIFLENILIRSIMRILPNNLRRFAYLRFLRSEKGVKV